MEIRRVVPNLQPNKRYVLKVRGTNRLGVSSDWSESIVIDTSGGVDSTDPAIILTPAVKSILLQWTAETDPTFDHYKIHVTDEETFTASDDNLYSTPRAGTLTNISRYYSTSELEWLPLEAGSTYYVQVFWVDANDAATQIGNEEFAKTKYSSGGVEAVETIAADSITAGSLTSGIIITGSISTAISGPRLVMDSTGIFGYALDGETKNFEYNNLDGRVSIRGEILGLRGESILPNGNFESSITGWAAYGGAEGLNGSMSHETGITHDGSDGSLKWDHTALYSEDSWFETDFIVSNEILPGSAWSAESYIYPTDADLLLTMHIVFYDDDDNELSDEQIGSRTNPESDVWTRFAGGASIAPDTASKIRLRFKIQNDQPIFSLDYNSAFDGILYLDDIGLFKAPLIKGGFFSTSSERDSTPRMDILSHQSIKFYANNTYQNPGHLSVGVDNLSDGEKRHRTNLSSGSVVTLGATPTATKQAFVNISSAGDNGAFSSIDLYAEQVNFIFPQCAAYSETAQTLNHDSWTVVSFDDDDIIDTHGFHNPASLSNRVIIPNGLDGVYRVEVVGLFKNENTSNNRGLSIVENKSGVDTEWKVATHRAAISKSTRIYGMTKLNLSGGDYVKVKAYQDAGIGLTVDLLKCWVYVTRESSSAFLDLTDVNIPTFTTPGESVEV